MLAEAAEPIAILAAAVAALVAGALGRGEYDRRRNRRNNNPNCKPGLGEVCLEHGRGIAAQGSAVAALGAQQAAIHKSQDETKVELREMRKESRDSFSALHRRFDILLSKQE